MKLFMKMCTVTFVTSIYFLDIVSPMESKDVQLCIKCKNRKANQKFRACQLLKLKSGIGKVKKDLDIVAKTMYDNYDYNKGQPNTNGTVKADLAVMITTAEDVLSYTYTSASSIYTNIFVIQAWGCSKLKNGRFCKKLKSASKRLRSILCTTSAVLHTGMFYGEGSKPKQKICLKYNKLCQSLLKSRKNGSEGEADIVQFAFSSVNQAVNLTNRVIKNIKYLIDNDIVP